MEIFILILFYFKSHILIIYHIEICGMFMNVIFINTLTHVY